MHVPFMPEQRIEADAYKTLRTVGVFDALPVDPQLVAEKLGLDVHDVDLVQHFQDSDFAAVLGCINVDDRRVFVQEALMKDLEEGRPGRYHYTIAHECGHWVLHREFHYLTNRQLNMFSAVSAQPSILCRAKDSSPIEIQANMFASFLLMPRHTVERVWHETFGTLQSAEMMGIKAIWELLDRANGVSSRWRQGMEDWLLANASKFIQRYSHLDRKRSLAMGLAADELTRSLAPRFEVSQEAMLYRLEALDLLPKGSRAVA